MGFNVLVTIMRFNASVTTELWEAREQDPGANVVQVVGSGGPEWPLPQPLMCTGNQGQAA